MARNQAQLADDIDETAPEESLRDTIEAARDEVVERYEAETGGTEAPEPAGRARTADGKFAPKSDAGEPAQEPAAQPAARGTGGRDPAAAAAAPAVQASPAPQGAAELAPKSWSASGKAVWANLPPEARAEIAKREQDIAQLTGRFDEERAFARQFSEVSQRHQDVVASQGMPPAKIYENMLGVIRILNSPDVNAKAALLRDVIRLNGIPPQLLGLSGQPQPASNAPGGAAPQSSALPPPVARVVNEWSQFQAERQREREAAELRAQHEVTSEIDSFRTKPEAEFFDAVQDQMIGLLTGGLAQNLEEAYRSAVALRPDIQAILKEREAQAQAAKAAKQQRVQQARLRGGSVRGGSGMSAPAETGNRSLREELAANFAEARARI